MDLIVQQDWQTGTVKIYLREREGQSAVIYGQKDGEVLQQQMPQTITPHEFVPLLSMRPHFFEDMCKAFAEYFSSTGKRTQNEFTVIGKLEATERHLEDMRKLVLEERYNNRFIQKSSL